MSRFPRGVVALPGQSGGRWYISRLWRRYMRSPFLLGEVPHPVGERSGANPPPAFTSAAMFTHNPYEPFTGMGSLLRSYRLSEADPSCGFAAALLQGPAYFGNISQLSYDDADALSAVSG